MTRPIESPQSKESLLIQYLWESRGGPAKVARLCKIHPDLPPIWRIRGSVPLHKVMRISKALNIDPWGLNYEDLHEFFRYVQGHTIPTWRQVVKHYNLGAEKEKELL